MFGSPHLLQHSLIYRTLHPYRTTSNTRYLPETCSILEEMNFYWYMDIFRSVATVHGSLPIHSTTHLPDPVTHVKENVGRVRTSIDPCINKREIALHSRRRAFARGHEERSGVLTALCITPLHWAVDGMISISRREKLSMKQGEASRCIRSGSFQPCMWITHLERAVRPYYSSYLDYT